MSPVWFVAWMVVGAVGVLGTISLPFLFPVVIVLGVALGVLFLGESVGPGTFAGLVLILGGSRLATGSR